MTHIQVSAGKTLLEGYIKSPPVGLCELVWNAFDEDANHVQIEIEAGALGGVDLIRVQDDGNGMNLERAEAAFSRVGDSWKLAPGTTSQHGRPVHGKYGRGRYAAFSLGSIVHWTSTSASVAGELATIRVRGSRASLDSFEIDEIPLESQQTGTRVEIAGVSSDAATQLDELVAVRQRLLTEFAVHLERHPDFKLSLLGSPVDPSLVIASRTAIDVDMPIGALGQAVLTVIEWNLANVDRRLYLCGPSGSIIDELQAGVQAVGAEFTAY